MRENFYMSNHWFTADLHLGHEFVARLRGFETTEDHDYAILSNIASTVRKQDVLWVLGDYAMKDHAWARDQISAIPCRKVLIPGNHDPEHPMHRNAWSRQAEAFDTFEAVVPYQRIRLSKVDFLMAHLPYEGDHKDVDRYDEYRLPNMGLPLLCGHVHAAWRFNGNQFNVGVDVNDFKPVSTNTILQWQKVIES